MGAVPLVSAAPSDRSMTHNPKTTARQHAEAAFNAIKRGPDGRDWLHLPSPIVAAATVPTVLDRPVPALSLDPARATLHLKPR